MTSFECSVCGLAEIDLPEGVDIDAVKEKWLGMCGPCDGGLPTSCTHPDEDYRPTMLLLVNEIERLRGLLNREAAL